MPSFPGVLRDLENDGKKTDKSTSTLFSVRETTLPIPTSMQLAASSGSHSPIYKLPEQDFQEFVQGLLAQAEQLFPPLKNWRLLQREAVYVTGGHTDATLRLALFGSPAFDIETNTEVWLMGAFVALSDKVQLRLGPLLSDGDVSTCVSPTTQPKTAAERLTKLLTRDDTLDRIVTVPRGTVLFAPLSRFAHAPLSGTLLTVALVPKKQEAFFTEHIEQTLAFPLISPIQPENIHCWQKRRLQEKPVMPKIASSDKKKMASSSSSSPLNKVPTSREQQLLLDSIGQPKSKPVVAAEMQFVEYEGKVFCVVERGTFFCFFSFSCDLIFDRHSRRKCHEEANKGPLAGALGW